MTRGAAEIVPWDLLVLDEAIRERHSTRMFLPQSVPLALVDESLALAQRAPSAWRPGARACDKLVFHQSQTCGRKQDPTVLRPL
jgi:nitroreductase